MSATGQDSGKNVRPGFVEIAADDYVRFSWANGLFGQMILDLDDRKPYLLQTNFQVDNGTTNYRRH